MATTSLSEKDPLWVLFILTDREGEDAFVEGSRRLIVPARDSVPGWGRPQLFCLLDTSLHNETML